jgi:hypothetical protein
MEINISILNTVIENGRVFYSRDGFDKSSLIAEIEFEAQERKLSKEEIQKAIEFAVSHTQITNV